MNVRPYTPGKVCRHSRWQGTDPMALMVGMGEPGFQEDQISWAY